MSKDLTNKRNQNGVKNAFDTYLNVKGKLYTQWTDNDSKEDCEREYPEYKFISRTIKGFTRVYKLND